MADVKDIAKMLAWEPAQSSSSSKKADPTMEEIAKKLEEMRPALADLLEEVENNPRGKDFGISFLDVKTQLQLSYLASLCYYLLLKVSNEQVKDHPVLSDLFFIRSLMEKIRPIDDRLRYRVEKLLSADEIKPSTAEENMRPDVDSLMTSIVDDEDEEEEISIPKAKEITKEDSDVYQVPKFSSVEYTGDHISQAQKANKQLDRQAERLRKSELVRSMREELTDAPTEIGGEDKLDKSFASFKKKLAHREEYEMENMTRLPTTRADKKEMKHMRHLLRTGKQAGNVMSLGEFAEIDSFIRDVDVNDTGKSKKKKKVGSGSALKGFRDAQQFAKDANSVVRKAGKFGVSEGKKGTKKHRKKPKVSDFAF
eukprot:gene947-501_t